MVILFKDGEVFERKYYEILLLIVLFGSGEFVYVWEVELLKRIWKVGVFGRGCKWLLFDDCNC